MCDQMPFQSILRIYLADGYLEDIFSGWAKFTYTASLESSLNADERWETVLIPTYSNIGSSFIDWGELLSSSHTEL